MLEWLLITLLAVFGIMAWQHRRYLTIRREYAEDSQRAFHSARAFHLITFFRVRTGERVIDSVHRFVEALGTSGQPQLIYAGQAGFTIASTQLGECAWDGFILLQFPSRARYHREAAPRINTAREVFADSYLHGMRRDRVAALMIPQKLLKLRLLDVLRGRWRPPSLEPSRAFAAAPEFDVWRRRISRLHALHVLNDRGLVVINLVKRNSPAQPFGDVALTRAMLSLMAARGHGPLHLGHAVALEGNARFDDVLVIHYPSPDYYAELLRSQLFQSALKNGQAADTMLVASVPVTALLGQSR
ncbi:MAG: hypothetical protein U5K56_01300 [Halioglobus sp.]|nr:hypothetical protein [Halioglobus sp.]